MALKQLKKIAAPKKVEPSKVRKDDDDDDDDDEEEEIEEEEQQETTASKKTLKKVAPAPKKDEEDDDDDEVEDDDSSDDDEEEEIEEDDDSEDDDSEEDDDDDSSDDDDDDDTEDDEKEEEQPKKKTAVKKEEKKAQPKKAEKKAPEKKAQPKKAEKKEEKKAEKPVKKKVNKDESIVVDGVYEEVGKFGSFINKDSLVRLTKKVASKRLASEYDENAVKAIATAVYDIVEEVFNAARQHGVFKFGELHFSQRFISGRDFTTIKEGETVTMADRISTKIDKVIISADDDDLTEDQKEALAKGREAYDKKHGKKASTKKVAKKKK